MLIKRHLREQPAVSLAELAGGFRATHPTGRAISRNWRGFRGRNDRERVQIQAAAINGRRDRIGDNRGRRPYFARTRQLAFSRMYQTRNLQFQFRLRISLKRLFPFNKCLFVAINSLLTRRIYLRRYGVHRPVDKQTPRKCRQFLRHRAG
jgi:hypothetical protein